MAVTNEFSDQITDLDATPVVLQDTSSVHGRLRLFRFTFTQSAAAGDADSSVTFARLHAHSRVIGHLSKMYFSAFGAARTLDVGYKAYTDIDGTAQVADADFFATAVDVSSAGSLVFDESDTAAAHQGKKFDGEVDLVCDVAVDTIPAAATLDGHVVYVLD